MNITRVGPENDQRWERFLQENDRATIYHHPAWINTLCSFYNYERLIVAIEDGKSRRLTGVVPFLLVDSWITGRRLVALPFTSYCDPLIPADCLGDVIRFAHSQFPDVDYVELRCRQSLACADELNEDSSSYVNHVLELDGSLDEIFEALHKTNVRQRLRKSKKYALKFKLLTSESDLKKFYDLLATIRKAHGLPVQPYRFFWSMWKWLLPRNMLLLPAVEFEGRIVAAATVLKFGQTFCLEYCASDQRFKTLCANQMLIWETIKLAVDQGANYFDFGRSNSGSQSLIKFKQRWGAQCSPLTYYRYPKLSRQANHEPGVARRFFESVNRRLPRRLLQLQGELIYPHRS